MEELNLDEFMDDLSQSIEFAKKVIKENYDPRNKEIGDRVIVWDFTSFTDENNNAFEGSDIAVNFKNIQYFIVIETKLKNVLKLFDDYEIYRDILVVNPITNKKYYVSSNAIKII